MGKKCSKVLSPQFTRKLQTSMKMSSRAPLNACSEALDSNILPVQIRTSVDVPPALSSWVTMEAFYRAST